MHNYTTILCHFHVILPVCPRFQPIVSHHHDYYIYQVHIHNIVTVSLHSIITGDADIWFWLWDRTVHCMYNIVLAHSATMVKHDIVSYTQSCNITPLSQSSKSIKIANFYYHSKNHQLSWGCILTIVIILMDQGTHVDDYMCMRYIANSQNLSYCQPHCLETAI